MNGMTSATTGQRGPAETEKRDAIVRAALEYFGRNGYDRATVSELAAAIGFSKAYIYKYFDSKRAIGEAICARCLGAILAAAQASVAEGSSAADKLRRLFRTITDKGVELFFQDRKLHDIAAASSAEQWSTSIAYKAQVAEMLRTIIAEGRETGEFERKTPIDDVVRGIMQAMQPFMHSLMLQHVLDTLPDAQTEVANLVLRGLAP